MTRTTPPSTMVRVHQTSLGDRVTTLGTIVTKHRRWLVLVGIGMMLALGSLALWVHRRVEDNLERQLSAQLSVTLDAAIGGVVAELESAERAAAGAAQSPELLDLLSQCLGDPGACTHDKVLGLAIEEHLRPHMTTGRFSKSLILNIADQRLLSFPNMDEAAEPVSLPALPASSRKPRLILPDQNAGESFLLVSAFKDERPIARLLFMFALSDSTRVLRVARAGTSGETYAFDGRGRLLSESRFTDELRELGLIRRDQASAVLALELRDPGGDLTAEYTTNTPRQRQPLTREIAAVLSKHSAVDVRGYRDYRGVEVVGAGRWLPQFGLGIVTEVDAAEAFRLPNQLDRLFLWLLVALVAMALLVLGGAALSAQLSRRVTLAEQVAAKFGQYVIQRKLGEGGMGSVYLAQHALLRRPAAIKLLRPDRITPDAVARFEREALMTSQLSHPNTVAVYDHGRTENGSLYYVMEYLDGLDLQRLVEYFGRLPAARVIHLMRQACGALSEAHGMGLVHRDVKPANLMVCSRGGMADILKVLDFGVVKSTKLNQVGLTASKLLLGTPAYMAPEMFDSSEQASAQSDLYALGAVAYFLLTGRTVFDVESPSELCLAHLTKTPEPLSARVEDVDPSLDMVIRACLAKKREARPKSALSVLTMLERSPLAHRWTSADAEAWWAAQADAIARIQTADSNPLSADSKGLHTIRPVV